MYNGNYINDEYIFDIFLNMDECCLSHCSKCDVSFIKYSELCSGCAFIVDSWWEKQKQNKYYVYALLGDRCTYPIVKINNFDNMMIECFGKKYESHLDINLINKIKNIELENMIYHDNFVCIGYFIKTNMKYVIISMSYSNPLNDPSLMSNIVQTDNPKSYIYYCLIKNNDDYGSDEEIEDNDIDNKIINKINNYNDIVIDIEYKYNCFKTGSCDFSSCVRIIDGNKLIENETKEPNLFIESSAKLIRDLKNAECSEDYFTPIYVFDVTSF